MYGRSRPLADGHGHTLPQPTQGAIDGCGLGAVFGIQHAPHLTLCDVELPDKAALRNPGQISRPTFRSHQRFFVNSGTIGQWTPGFRQNRDSIVIERCYR